jgi:hypothetical protein
LKITEMNAVGEGCLGAALWQLDVAGDAPFGAFGLMIPVSVWWRPDQPDRALGTCATALPADRGFQIEIQSTHVIYMDR